jgi:tetratricopeptide (TPR) repeat protein/CHAT domain-containing protein
LAAGDVHRYRVEVAPGSYMHFAAQPRGIHTLVTLLEPDESTVFEAEIADGQPDPEALEAVSVSGGSYSLTVQALEKNVAAGEYRLTLGTVRPAGDQEQDLVEGEKGVAEARQAQGQGSAASLAAAVEKFRSALTTWRRMHATRREVATLWSISAIHLALTQHAEALDDARQLLGLADALGSARIRGQALNVRGMVEYVLGDPAAADTFQEALEVWTRYVDLESESDTLNQLAIIHRNRGEEQTSLDLYLRALALRRAVGDKARESMSLHNLGVFYAEMGVPERAREYFEQALALSRASRDPSGQGASLLELGLVYSAVGEVSKAIETAREAVRVTEETGNRRWQSRALVRAGRVYDAAGDRDTAAQYFQRSLEVSRAISDLTGESDTLRAIGRSELAAGRSRPAREALGRALSIVQSLGDRSRTMRVLGEVAAADRAVGDVTAAREHSEAALALTEALRGSLPNHQLRGSMLAGTQALYDFHVDVLMEANRLEANPASVAAALETSERSRARSFLELLAESGRDVSGCPDRALAERDRALEKRLDELVERRVRAAPAGSGGGAAISREIHDVTREHDLIEVQMRAGCAGSATVLQAQPLTLAEIQEQVLDDRTVLLEYHLGAERSYLWAVTRRSVSAHELPKAAEIEALARRWHERLSSGTSPPEETRRDAEALSAMLVAPAADYLPGRRLLTVAGGALQYLPFGALPSPGKRDTPLVVDHEIVSAPSASFVAVLRRRLAGRSPAAKTLAVLADPVFDAADERVAVREQGTATRAPAVEAQTRDLTRAAADVGLGSGAISRLPFTRREAMALLSLVPEGQRMEALDFSASRATAMSTELGQYRYVHFATHGFMDSAHPELSGIVLSLVDRLGREQSGFLPASQVFDLKLPAQLCVLSGCRTELGT